MLKDVIMRKFGYTSEEADAEIEDARRMVLEAAGRGDFNAADEVLSDMFGLEPDYLFDLIG